MRALRMLVMLGCLVAFPTALAHPHPVIVSVEDAANPEAVDAALDEVLHDELYTFCHRETYPLSEDEAIWCPVIGDETPHCTAWAEVCKNKNKNEKEFRQQEPCEGCNGQAERSSGSGQQASRSGSSGQQARRSGRRPGGGDRSEVRVHDPGLGLGGLPFWIVLAIFAVIAIVMVVKSIVAGRRAEKDDDTLEKVTVDDQDLEEGIAARVSERDSTRLLQLAAEAAAAGRYLEAVQLCHMALLLRLDSDELIRLHPSRTHGDYLVDLRAHPAMRAGVRTVFRAVEPIFFGGRPATREHFEKISKTATTLLGHLSTMLVCLAALGLMSCVPGDSTYSPYSPSGHQALIDLGTKLGWSLGWRTEPIEGMEEGKTPKDGDDDLVLPTPQPPLFLLGDYTPSSTEWKSILAWADNGHSLVLAGRALPLSQLGVSVKWTDQSTVGSIEVHGDLGEHLAGQAFVLPFVGYLQIEGEDFETLLSVDGKPYAVRLTSLPGRTPAFGRASQVIVFADDQLFTNAGMATADNGRLTTRLTETIGTDSEFVDELFGADGDTPAEKLHAVGLTPVLLQFLLLACAFLLWRGVHFGRPRESIDRKRRDFGDHVRALGTGYARGKAADHAFSIYGAWLLTQLRSRQFAGARTDLEGVAAAAAEQTTFSAEEITALLHQATEDTESTPDGDELNKLRRLTELYHDIRRRQ